MEITLPPIHAINTDYNSNPLVQLLSPSEKIVGHLEAFSQARMRGYKILSDDTSKGHILALHTNAHSVNGFPQIIKFKLQGTSDQELADSIFKGSWIEHPLLKDVPKRVNFKSRLKKINDSWKENFSYQAENTEMGVKGLRKPQLGAIHAIQAHWFVSKDTATVVMPTGTGKTETMLSVTIINQCKTVLVIVPTDALRTQIANKFLSWGELKNIGVLKSKTLNPIVGILKHELHSPEEVKEFFGKCNVVVTTSQIAGRCSPEVQKQMSIEAPYLFIDEAHHVAARTWKEFKENFKDNYILQFTATPFREDGKAVDGKRIFTYPLKKAQEEGYFKKINFKPIFEYDPNNVDNAIAEAAVAQLKEDLKTYDHILMARVDSIERAGEVLQIYSRYEEFNPVQIHTGLTTGVREEARQNILSKKSKIVVCVDMLGEGFDLPELKIAAFHDVKKSLPTTLQLVGRFTRTGANIGEPTFIANAGDVKVNEELQMLYSQDADWNTLLGQSSEKANLEQEELWEFLDGFQNVPKEIPLQNIRPALSTIVFKTQCEHWNPENFKEGIDGIDRLEHLYHSVNPQKNAMFIITARKSPIDWAKLKDVYDWTWELNVLYWDEDQKLLFINSSSNNGYFQNLAKAVAGDNVELISGGSVFRCLSGINRLMLQNVGLIEVLGKFIRYTMRSGSDVETGLTEAQKRAARKANIFGAGYENGGKASIGCSYKGRIWSRRVGTIDTLTRWCSLVGKKILDESIDPDEVLKGTLIPKPVSTRPNDMPVCIDWPDYIYLQPEEIFNINIDGETFPLYETEIRLKDPSITGDIKFEITSQNKIVEFALQLFETGGHPDYKFTVLGEHAITIKQHSVEMPLSDFFYKNPPMIWLANGASLEGCNLTELKQTNPPYDPAKIQVWDWTGTDIRKESQGLTKETDSIQSRAISEIKQQGYDIVFDDDGAGEIADIVAIKDEGERIKISFTHCKYSSQTTPGGRIEDLYTVCGQAQKSVHWRETPDDIFRRMQKREPKNHSGQSASRFEVGDRELLRKIQMKARNHPVDIDVSIVQPGVSKSSISQDQLQLLSVTENYLMQTYQLPFKVIISP